MFTCACGAAYEHRSQMVGCMKLHGPIDPIHLTNVGQTNEQQRISSIPRSNEQDRTFESSDNVTISEETKRMRFEEGQSNNETKRMRFERGQPNNETKASATTSTRMGDPQAGQLYEANFKYQTELHHLVHQLTAGFITKEQWATGMQKIFHEFLTEVNAISS